MALPVAALDLWSPGFLNNTSAITLCWQARALTAGEAGVRVVVVAVGEREGGVGV